MSNYHYLQSWLSEPPKCSVFRINKLMKFDCNVLQICLQNQKKHLNCTTTPKFYFLKSDCIIIEQWPEEIVQDTSRNKIIVDSLCAAAVLRGAHVYAPGVLGLSTNSKINEQVDIYGDIEGQCKRGLKIEYTGKKTYVGTGYLKMVRYELFDKGIQPNGIAVHTLLPASRLPVINESIYPRGQVLLQNLPSIIVGWVVDAKPFEYILDMCAAPGNKTTHLAEMSNNEAIIIAIDKTEAKVNKIKQTCETQGVKCVTTYVHDSTKCHCNENNSKSHPPFSSNTFDKVLLDAPCSGLGQRPQLNYKMSPNMLKSYKYVQRKLFEVAVKVLKVGGKLVYSTCTVTVDENEDMVSWVLDKYPCLKLIRAEPLLGGPGFPGVGLSDEHRVMVQRFGPEDDPLRPVGELYKSTIGFFIAAFTKVTNHKL